MKVFLRAAATALTAWAASASAQKDLDIFLLIGQSNMAGRGIMIAADSTTDIAGAWLLKDTSGWEPARNPLNRYSTAERMGRLNQVGPGFGFAMRMRKHLPKTEFGLVVRHQGEADRSDTAYVTRVSAFIDSLRKEFGRPDLPFIAGQLGPWGTKYAAFNSLIPTLETRRSSTAVVRSDNLTHKGDTVGGYSAFRSAQRDQSGGTLRGRGLEAGLRERESDRDTRGGRGKENRHAVRRRPPDLLGRRGRIDIRARQLILYPGTDRE